MRNGQELAPLFVDDHYDFNFQATRRPQSNNKVMPGDELIAECVYDTSERKNATVGGQATTNEMCAVFLMVHPIPKLSACLQVPSLGTQLGSVDMPWTFGEYEPGVSEVKVRNAVEENMPNLDWTNPDLVKKFEDIRRFGKVIEVCWTKHRATLTQVS